jgi:cellulose synthase/poly-beta-1,6-N-acetylglucosamine synthase-like glycosyltransferase
MAGMLPINLILLLAALPGAGLAFYLLGLTVAACLHPARRRIDGRYEGPRTARTHFLILIPAHNEELLLGEVLDRLRQLTYPVNHTTLAVIADNCTDSTAAVARQHGALVWERTDTLRRGKGQALDWAMRTRIPSLEGPCEAVVILDADSTVNPDFLWFMDEQLAQGREVLQGYYGVQNPLESWRTALTTVSLAAFHFLRPLGRDRLGLPCGLKGNGMCFARRLVTQYGYPAFSVVEDVELALFYLQQGIRVQFVPGAQVMGQMAVSAQAAGTQRARWEGGRLALLRRHCWPLLREGVRRRDAARLDGALDLLVPPFAILWAATVLPALGVAVWWLVAPHGVWPATAVLCGGALGAELLYVLVALRLIRAPAGVYWRLAAVPLFLAWKLVVYVRMFQQARRGGAEEWIRTDRTAMKKK